jgi:hypothetical protein
MYMVAGLLELAVLYLFRQRINTASEECPMDVSSPEMKDILDAITILKSDKEQGRARLLQLWDDLAPQGNPLQLCALGHFLADTETEVAAELEWDLRALEAATGSRQAEDKEPVPSVPESYLPSLHLSLANGYRRLGDLERARRHALFASLHIGALSDDAYGNLVRGGLRRLEAVLASPEDAAAPRSAAN